VPTLLIAGENDPQVIELNRRACRILSRPPKKLVIVPGASHLFEDGSTGGGRRTGKNWFGTYLAGGREKTEAA